MKKIVIHSDGGCEGNPGPGGWAAVLRYGRHVREIFGGVPATTNNRMELQAAIEALNALKECCTVEFHTDSQYVRLGITEWLPGWKAKGWRTAGRKRVKNEDQWRALESAASRHTIEWKWVKGHAGNADNERCDFLAGEAIRSVMRAYSKEQREAALLVFRERDESNTPTLF